jgi:hypothetical protein
MSEETRKEDIKLEDKLKALMGDSRERAGGQSPKPGCLCCE